MIALFIAGGSGTRLWPLSRVKTPKQLQPIIGEKPLISQTVERIRPLIEPRDVWIITNREYTEEIALQVPAVPPGQIIAEPFPIGTNLAAGLGALHIARRDPDAVIVLGWADAYIGKPTEFIKAVEAAAKLAPEVDGVILGVHPSYPATSYGYIEAGACVAGHASAFRIARFEEKPSFQRAQSFVGSGRHFWNPGISVWRAATLLKLIEMYKPDHYAALQTVAQSIGTTDEFTCLEKAFRDLDPAPIDHCLFEKAQNLATIPADLDWSDVGSWSAVYELQVNGSGSNVTSGAVVTLDTAKCLIYAKKRLVATLGVSDLVIVETEDAVLIARKSDTDRLKELYAQVKDFGGSLYL